MFFKTPIEVISLKSKEWIFNFEKKSLFGWRRFEVIKFKEKRGFIYYGSYSCGWTLFINFDQLVTVTHL